MNLISVCQKDVDENHEKENDYINSSNFFTILLT